jgi:nicotinamidase-related amidase
MSTTLIVIDMQEPFRRSPGWAQLSDPGVVGRVGALVSAARRGGHGVVWVLHGSPGSGGPFDPENGQVRLMEEFSPASGEPVLVKTSRNAFTTTRLGQHLTAAGVDEVVICGIQTEQCCETTARLAADLGYRVAFVTEATATFPIRRPDTGAMLDAAAVIERTEFALAGRFARIATVDTAFGTAAAADAASAPARAAGRGPE